MSLSMTYQEFLRYSIEERDKWRRFFAVHPEAMEYPVASPRYGTIGKLIDHIFLIERRHVQRLRGEALSERTGLTGNNAPPLFDYGASVRRELEHYVDGLDEDVANQLRTFDVGERQWRMSARKLLLHILVHETRHWAQIAMAVRAAGLEPPGDHDLFFSKALH
jgi:uncharacterized damage-inducible protein DinB